MMIEEGVEKCDDGDKSGGRTLRDPLIPSTSPQTEGFIFEKLRGGNEKGNPAKIPEP